MRKRKAPEESSPLVSDADAQVAGALVVSATRAWRDRCGRAFMLKPHRLVERSEVPICFVQRVSSRYDRVRCDTALTLMQLHAKRHRVSGFELDARDLVVRLGRIPDGPEKPATSHRYEDVRVPALADVLPADMMEAESAAQALIVATRPIMAPRVEVRRKPETYEISCHARSVSDVACQQLARWKNSFFDAEKNVLVAVVPRSSPDV